MEPRIPPLFVEHYQLAARLAIWLTVLDADELAHCVAVSLGDPCTDPKLREVIGFWRDGVACLDGAPVPFAISFRWAHA